MRFEAAIAAQGRNLRQSSDVVRAGLKALDLARWRRGCLAFTGMGASWHALSAVVPGLLAAGRPVIGVDAGELESLAATGFVDSVVAVSQSGRSAETLEALAAVGGLPRLLITDAPESPGARLSEAIVPLGLMEDSVVYTLGFTATIQALGLLAAALAGEEAAGSWEGLPDAVEGVLAEAAIVAGGLAEQLGVPRAVDLVGGGTHLAAAGEGGLILREAARIPTSCHTTRQYLHGPMEALGDGSLVVLLGDGREILLASDVARTGARVLLVTTADMAPTAGVTVLRLPTLEGAQLAVLEILPLQLLAGELAQRQGIELKGFRFEQGDTKVDASGDVHTEPRARAPRRRVSLGIDVGGSKIACVLASGRAGDLEFFDAVPTPRVDPAGVLRAGEELAGRALEVARRQHLELAAVGVAFPEVVGLDGHILSDAVVPGVDADEWVKRFETLAPVRVESDVRVAARAEAVAGSGRGSRSFCYITVGTGVSYSLVLDGVVQTGARGAAIQLGNSVAAEWDLNGVRRQWILEEIASGPALLARYRELGGTSGSPEEILIAYGSEESATRAVAETARSLGIGVALLVNLLDPELVVVGGGLGSAPGPFWELSVVSAREHIWCEAARSLPIVQAQLGARSAAVGAAIVALEAASPPAPH